MRAPWLVISWVAAALAVTTGCSGSDQDTKSGSQGEGYNVGSCASAAYTENLAACTPAATDYQPRAGHLSTNGWPACVSDDNSWHLMGASIPPAASRVAAYVQMGTKLWHNTSRPSKEDFLAARDLYSIEEGLASRIGRRQDISYAEISSDKFACSDPNVAVAHPDRCAGPGKLKPIIDDAFVNGIAQTKPLVQAARLEAALTWFFYLSMTSEVWTCSFDDITDCDAAGGYYTQLTQRGTPTGMAAAVHAQSPGTHDRIYDALLAARCWRDVDAAMPAADNENTAGGLYNKAQAQLSKAALRGEALLLRERIGWIACGSADNQEANIAYVSVLGGLIDHAAAAIDATQAAALRAFTSAPTNDSAKIVAAQAALDALFACP
ncbi:MAG TPA: hypothetical protein VFH51_00525 [Myxococcota bacterium]|nr:hypothetical protein [Myxococcota bacterium]